MDNLFDSANWPDTVPAALTAGEHWGWKRSDITSAYPTASYTLQFRLSLLAEPFSDQTITAAKVSAAHQVEVLGNVSKAYDPGEYSWFAVIVRDSDSEEKVIDQGRLTIYPDIGDAPGDIRTWLQVSLANIKAVIAEQASKAQSSYSIGGRSLSNRTYTELLELEQNLAARLKKEDAKADMAAGRSTAKNTILVRF